jgi:hypothetical protein
MGDDDEFIGRSYPTDSGLIGGDLDLRAAIANQNRAQRNAGMREGDAPRPSRGRPERVERRLDDIGERVGIITRGAELTARALDEGFGSLAGHARTEADMADTRFRHIAHNIRQASDATDDGFRLLTRMMGQTGAEHSEDIRRLASLLDSNDDGRVTNGELRDASGNQELLDEVKKISPLIARTLKDPNFRIRQIERRDIGVLPAKRHEINDQVETIRQGFGGYVEDVNMFNVDRV